MLLTKWTTAFALAALASFMAPVAREQSASPVGGSAKPADNDEQIRRIEQSAAVVPQAEGKPPITYGVRLRQYIKVATRCG